MMGLTGFISLDNIKYFKTSLWDLSKYLRGLLFFNVHYTNEKRIQFDLGNVQYLCYTAGSL